MYCMFQLSDEYKRSFIILQMCFLFFVLVGRISHHSVYSWFHANLICLKGKYMHTHRLSYTVRGFHQAAVVQLTNAVVATGV